MKKIFILMVLFLITKQYVTAQTVTNRTINFKELASYEAAHPELFKECKTCPRKEADGAWENLDNPYMPFPSGANIKRQQEDKTSPSANNPIPMAASRVPANNFLGHVDVATTIPPDTHGAVGLNHVITATNNFIKIHNKVTGAQISQVSVSSFTGVSSTCDPYMTFDPTGQRWIFSAIGCANVGNPVILMVSNTSDPTGTWRIITFVPAGPTMLLDHPYLGFDNGKLVVSGRRFEGPTLSTAFFTGCSLFLIDKTAMYTGTAITFGTNAQQIDKTGADGDSPLPVTVYDPPFSNVGNPSPGTVYILQAWNGTSIRLSTVTGNIPAAVWNSGTAVFPSGGTPWINSFAGSGTVQQMVETRLLAANDARISCGVMMNGKIWCSQHIGFGAPVDRIAVQWWQLEGSPGGSFGNVLQRGRVGDATANSYNWFSSIAVNKNEDVLIGFSNSTSTSRANAAYVTRQAATPANTTDDILIYKTGLDRYWKDFGSGRPRWGDYSHSSLDPVDNSLWTIQEYAEAGAGAIPPDNNSRWSTWWAQVPPSVIICTPPTITAPTVTQPTCATPTGTIVVNATGSGVLEYALNNGTYQSSATFSGLAAGSYNITVRLQSSPACIATYSGNPVVLSAAVCNGKTIPGRIEAESWDAKLGPQYAIPTGDVGGGQQVVGITNGSWLDYNVNVLSTGTYTVNFRVATTQNNAQFQIKLGATVLGTINIPNTGGWSTWVSVPVSNIPLTAGLQTIRIQSTNNESCNFNWTDWALTSPPASNVIPGRIEAENFSNRNTFPPVPPYPIASCDVSGGGQVMVGFISGTFMEYNVNVLQSGNYKVSFRYASTQIDDAIQVRSMPSGTILATVPLSNQGGWCNFATTAPSAIIALLAGQQTIRLTLVSNNPEGVNLNWMEWVPDAAPECIPRIEAESFSAKLGGQYAVTTDDPAGGGQHIAGFINGNWLDYIVTVPATGTYTFNFRVATQHNTVKFQILSGGVPVGTLVPVLNTGGWSNWQTPRIGGVPLTAGLQTIRIQVVSTNNEGCNFNWFQICPDGVPLSVADVVSTKVSVVAPIQKVIKTNDLLVSVLPNPSNDYFNLKVQSRNMEVITIKVVDIAGRPVQQLQAVPGQTMRFGSNIVKGTYFVEVRQGKEKVVLKVMKQ